jgi:hypothetical protein
VSALLRLRKLIPHPGRNRQPPAPRFDEITDANDAIITIVTIRQYFVAKHQL